MLGPQAAAHPALPSPRPWSPSPRTSPEEREVIAPRQAPAPFPQKFAQAAAASRKPGAETSPGCPEGGCNGVAVPRFHLQPLAVLRPGQAGLRAGESSLT